MKDRSMLPIFLNSEDKREKNNNEAIRELEQRKQQQIYIYINSTQIQEDSKDGKKQSPNNRKKILQ